MAIKPASNSADQSQRSAEICKDGKFGLTKLYNLRDDGAYTDLKKLHKQLDEAVIACYGWPKSAGDRPPAERPRPGDQSGHPLLRVERATGIGPAYQAWEASALPLSYARIGTGQ